MRNIFYLLCSFSVFRGKWLNISNNTAVSIQPSPFLFNMSEPINSLNFSYYSGILSFNKEPVSIIQKKRTKSFRIYGISNINSSQIFFFKIFPAELFNPEKKFQTLIEQKLCELNFSTIINQSFITEIILQELLPDFPNISIYPLELRVGFMKNNDCGPYDLPFSINGSFLYPKNFSAQFSGLKFNENIFHKELSIFSVLIGFYAIFAFYAWNFINHEQFTTPASLQHQSIHTILLLAGYDFAFGFFLFSFSEQNTSSSTLFVFIFVCMMIIYYHFQIRYISMVLANLINQNFEDIENRLMIFKFLIEELLFLSMMLIAWTEFFFHPAFFSFILNSCLIPQIFHNVNHPSVQKGKMPFYLLVFLQHTVLSWYFVMYSKSVTFFHSPFLFWSNFVYSLLQILILYFQTKFRGDFFMPSKFKSQLFNYHGSYEVGSECPICLFPLEENDSVMVTPCHHCFHQECLERWMEQQLVCPVCRSELPSSL